MRAQGCGDVPRVAPGSPHPPSLLHARACSAALFTKSLEMRRRYFNDYFSAESRLLNTRQVSSCIYACVPQIFVPQNRRTALASPHSHATCQPHRCQVRFCLQELQLPHKARSMYSLSSMELFFCNCLAMCSARCRLHMASLLSPSHSVTHVDPVEVHVSAEGGSAPLCPTLNPYLPIKGVMGCKSGTLERPTTGDPTNRMLPSPPCDEMTKLRSARCSLARGLTDRTNRFELWETPTHNGTRHQTDLHHILLLGEVMQRRRILG